jgi:hypothetical protein
MAGMAARRIGGQFHPHQIGVGPTRWLRWPTWLLNHYGEPTNFEFRRRRRRRTLKGFVFDSAIRSLAFLFFFDNLLLAVYHHQLTLFWFFHISNIAG